MWMDYYIVTIQYTSHLMVIWLLGTKVYIYKEKDLPDGFVYSDTILMTANHLSELDPMYISILYDRYFGSKSHIVSFVKHTLRFYPFINSLLLSSGSIFVQNKNTQQNVGQHSYIANKLRTAGSTHKKTVLIFPEGTTYSDKVKKYREDNSEKHGTPTFKNLLIPKTNGLHLIRKHSGVGDEFNVAMKFINRKVGDDPSLIGLLKGETPKEVHLLLTRRANPFDSNNMAIENRHLFDKDVYESFGKMDNLLSQSPIEWSNSYDRTEVKPSWETILWSLLYGFISFKAIQLIFTNRYFMVYSLLSLVFFYIAALFEFRRSFGNEKSEKID